VGAATPTPTPSPPTGAPSAGGPGAPGVVPTATPTPTPTATPEIIKETVAESTYTYTPSPEELKEIMEEAGFEAETIERAVEQAGNVQITRELVVERQENTATGEITYQSRFSIKIFNSSDKRFEDITIVEYIPKEVAASASEIRSLAEFEVLKEDPIIAWHVDKLEPQQVLVVEYWVDKNVDKEAFEQGKTLFQAAKEEVVVAKSSLMVYVITEEGLPIEEPIEISLLDESGNIVSIKYTEKGRVEFTELDAGRYTIKAKETTNYYGASQEVVLAEGAEKIVQLTLEKKVPITKPTVPPEEKPKVDYTLLIVLIVLACIAYVLYFYGKKKKVAAAKKPKRRKRRRGKKKKREEGEEKTEHMEGEVRRPFADRRAEEKFRIE
jgi:hypothetical protein